MPSKKLPLTVQTPERLDLAVLRALAAFENAPSRRRLKDLLSSAQVKVRPVTAPHLNFQDPALLLQTGEYEIQLENYDPSQREEARPETGDSRPEILYEDSDWLVLNKASGMPSVPHRADELHTAVNLALVHCPALRGIGDSPLEPGLLHRLDTGTSGALAFAKSQAEFERIRGLWKTPSVRKIYRALASPASSETPELDLRSGRKTIDVPLGQDAKSSSRLRALTPEVRIQIRGEPLAARTLLLSARSNPAHGPNVQDFEIEIETGVRHQIRVHLASIGYPLLGDTTYGGKPAPRLWLHAWKLILPKKNGASIEIEAPLPEFWSSLRS